MPCGILVPYPGVEPRPPALTARSLSHWTTREVPRTFSITPKETPHLLAVTPKSPPSPKTHLQPQITHPLPSLYISLFSVQFSCSVVSNSFRSHELQHARHPCPTNSWSLRKPMSTESVMPSNHLILCRPLLLLSSIFPSIRVFSNESALHMRWPKYWSFSFNISPSNEHPGLISFRMDWLDLLAVQGTLKNLI